MTSAEVVDLHAHVLLDDLPDLAAETGDGRWPRVVVSSEHPDRGEVRCGDQRFRTVHRALWDTEARILGMDANHVDVQVLSPMPVAITYWARADDALRFSRAQNDGIAAAVDRSGGRLLGLGTVPLQDPPAAVAEMRRAMSLGLSGIEIGTVVAGAELDHDELRPFFRAAADDRVPLFVHPIDGGGATRCSNPQLDFAIGMHTDTSLAAYALVYGGVLAELPELRVCLSHGGGAFPWTHPRLRLLDRRDAGELDTLVRRLWVDTLVFDADHLPLLAARYGADHLVLGTDDPFISMTMHDPRVPLDDAAARGLLDPESVAAIKGANARSFLDRDGG